MSAPANCQLAAAGGSSTSTFAISLTCAGADNHNRRQSPQFFNGLLVVVGVVLKSFCSIKLFLVDEGITQQLLSQRLLSPEQKDRITRAIKPFASVSFVAMTAPEEEPWEFVLNISATLKQNGWNWESFPERQGYLVLQPINPEFPREGMTIANRIVLLCPPELHDLAEALAAALKEPNVIGMENVTVLTQPNVQMTVIVGSKR